MQIVGSQAAVIVALAAGHEALLIWMLGITGATGGAILLLLVAKWHGLKGVEAWLGEISTEVRAEHTQLVVEGAQEIYRLQNLNGAVDDTATDTINDAAAQWLTAIDGWLVQERIRKGLVKKSVFLTWALLLHVVSAGATVVLHRVGSNDKAWFAYAAITAVITLAVSIFFVGPFFSLVLAKGTPHE